MCTVRRRLEGAGTKVADMTETYVRCEQTIVILIKASTKIYVQTISSTAHENQLGVD